MKKKVERLVILVCGECKSKFVIPTLLKVIGEQVKNL